MSREAWPHWSTSERRCDGTNRRSGGQELGAGWSTVAVRLLCLPGYGSDEAGGWDDGGRLDHLIGTVELPSKCNYCFIYIYILEVIDVMIMFWAI